MKIHRNQMMFRIGTDVCIHEFTVPQWVAALTVAQMHGWNPRGTINPGVEPWHGDYVSGKGSVMLPEDSADFVAALEKAHPHVCNLESDRRISPPTRPIVFWADPYAHLVDWGSRFLEAFIMTCRGERVEIDCAYGHFKDSTSDSDSISALGVV